MEKENVGLDSQSPLAKRLIVSTIFSVITLYLMFWAPDFLFFLGVELVILLSLNEFFVLVEKKHLPVNRLLGLLLGACIPLSFYFPVEPIIIIFTMLVLFLVGLNQKQSQSNHTLIQTAITLFGIIYIAWTISYFLKLRAIPDTGHFWVFFVIFVVKMGDGGAYFIGRKWGSHKFIRHISPGKSLEGAFSCTVVSIICALLCKFYLPEVSLFHFFILGLSLSVLAQLGDLVESMIKRNLGAKDSGEIPGLGGMLDITDSLIFTVPFLYAYITLVQL